jgi:preprotein translocase subunit SecE
MQWWNRLRAFLGEVVVETKKVSWPNRREVVSTTTVVIIASFIFGTFLYLCDFVLLFLTRNVFKFFGVLS